MLESQARNQAREWNTLGLIISALLLFLSTPLVSCVIAFESGSVSEMKLFLSNSQKVSREGVPAS